MRALLLLIAICPALYAAAHQAARSSDVIEAVVTSLYSDHDDARLAKQLKTMRITEQLDPHIAIYFRHMDLGPQSLEVVQHLVEDSAELPKPAEVALSIQPVPLEENRVEVLDRLTQYARSYIHNLPNFICRQITRRYTNLTPGASKPDFSTSLHHGDTLDGNVSFFGGVEQGYFGSNPAKKMKEVDTKGGHSISIGEFGGDMAMIFGSDVGPAMAWDHWEMFRGRRRAVFSYFVGLPESKFGLYFCCVRVSGGRDTQQTYTSAIRGLVYVDPDSGLISRLTIRAVNMPAEFHIKESQTIIDYGSVSIDGHAYTLPVEALIFVRSDRQKNRNEISFTKYRKFDPASVITSVDSTITYETEGKK